VNILHFGKYSTSHAGGIERHVKTLTVSLASRGLNVINLVASKTGVGNDTVTDGVRTVEIPSYLNIAGVAVSPKMICAARRLHATYKFDVVHLHLPDPMSHLAYLSLPKQIPLVVTWHSDVIRQRQAQKIYQPFINHLLKRASGIIAASQVHFSNSSQIKHINSTNTFKQHVVPYAVDEKLLTPRDVNQFITENLMTLSKGLPIVFALGRHVDYKGFDILIRAMVQTNSFLFLGGNGPETKKLKQLVTLLNLNSRIHFLGYISEEHLASYYYGCDIFVLPSISAAEAFGIVQIEAMLCGKPVISTRLGTATDIINIDGLTGLVVEPRNVLELATAINLLSTNPAKAKQLGQQAMELAIQKFSSATMTNAHIGIYEKVTLNMSATAQ
jgi:glycosyltransferase involved in cell wall biosynthesis